MRLDTVFIIATVLAFGPGNAIAEVRICSLALGKIINGEVTEYLEDTLQHLPGPAGNVVLEYEDFSIQLSLTKNCWPKLKRGSVVPKGYSLHVYSPTIEGHAATSAVLEDDDRLMLPGFDPLKMRVQFYEWLVGLSWKPLNKRPLAHEPKPLTK
ncbi:uncharacterized protein PgNI_12059 [Pyricularia grisea]|uniref:Uncharacterized protein n=1 Tax=Pyricularia grisea TaxID=148305 RepID=A0A6P8AQF3_PYRGI|nr:uncharacterized protein PgNI_12059 [Pyricularia grisea]TLD04278.1 hypothetical protein PgNI_12059 [Pyricularia grisea]